MHTNKKTLICNKNFDKRKIKDLIEWFIANHGTLRTNKLLNQLKTTGFNYSTKAGISIGPNDLLIPEIKEKLIKNTEIKINKKSINYTTISTQEEIETWNITNEIVKNEIIKNYRQTDLLNPIYIMIQSGARGNISQIKQIVGLRGLMSDSKGEIINTPIKNNFKEGLTIKEYFISCYGARKGIIDTALKTANSGYLTRKLVYVAQNITIKQQDCYTNNAIIVNLISKNKKNYNINKNKILGRILAENIIDKKTNKLKFSKGQDICNYIAKKLLKNSKEVFLRSPLKCNLNIGICQICYGWNLATNKMVRVKEAVGILAAQSIGEPGTQLTMRTFHTGGIFTSEIASIIHAPHKGKILFSINKNLRKIKGKHQQTLFLSLEKSKNIYIKRNKYIVSRIVLPKYSTIYVENHKQIFNKQIIAEIPKWKKTKTEKENKKIFKEIKNTNTGEIKVQVHKTKIIWVLNGQLVNNESLFKKIFTKEETLINLKDKICRKIKKLKEKTHTITTLNYQQTKKLKTRAHLINKNQKIYEISKKNKYKKEILINRKHNKEVTKKVKRGNIGKSLNKPLGLITEVRFKNLIIRKGEAYKTIKDSKVTLKNSTLVNSNTILFKNFLEKEKNKDIVDGLPKIEQILEAKQIPSNNIQKNKCIHEQTKKLFQILSKKYENKIANKKTLNNIQRFLVKQIQNVYTSQGINISEKHIEVIVKQMTSKVIVKSNTELKLIQGEIININKIEKIINHSNQKLSYEPIVIGITKSSLLNESFISAACFQETIRIITKSAIMGKIDWLTGLKENILLGNLIPIGTN